jgi:serine protease Do
MKVRALFHPGSILICALLFGASAHADKSLWTKRSRSQKAATTIKLPSLSPLVERVRASMLVILTETEVKTSALGPGHPPIPEGMPLPPWFKESPPGQMPPGFRSQGQGSGFLIHPSGYALTNHHVVENARRIKVRVGRSLEEIDAELVGSDAATDIALIKLKSKRKNWPVVPLGDSEKLAVGDFVVAIGNPFGLDLTVSMGILSARSRHEIAPSGRVGLYDFLQTDASINPGNSGGPLLNLAGEVVGINSAVNMAGQGIGFAIPINMVKRLLPQLRDRGRVARSWIGVSIQKVSPALAKALGLKKPHGALIRQVQAASPAADAGLEPGDVIVKFDGEAIRKSSELPLLAGLAGVGKTVQLQVYRDGKAKSVSIKLGEMPQALSTPQSPHAPAPNKEEPKVGSLGLAVVTLNADDRRRLGLPKKVQGIRIVKVAFGSPAHQAGLEKDDVVIKANGKAVKDAQGFARIAKALPGGEALRLLVRRGDSTLFIALVKPGD